MTRFGVEPNFLLAQAGSADTQEGFLEAGQNYFPHLWAKLSPSSRAIHPTLYHLATDLCLHWNSLHTGRSGSNGTW